MKKITAQQFIDYVENNPAWASKLTEPVEITDFCFMAFNHISHLSPLLKFTGQDVDGNAATFNSCKNLKVAEGTFQGFVSFAESRIQKIGELKITHPDRAGNAAGFEACKNLEIAEGTFAGFVNFDESGINRIGNLTITRPDNGGDAVYFRNCKNLTVAEGTFPGRVSFYQSGITKIGKLTITKPSNQEKSADFEGCNNLILPKNWLERKDITIDEDLKKRSELQIAHEAAARKAMKQPTFEW